MTGEETHLLFNEGIGGGDTRNSCSPLQVFSVTKKAACNQQSNNDQTTFNISPSKMMTFMKWDSWGHWQHWHLSHHLWACHICEIFASHEFCSIFGDASLKEQIQQSGRLAVNGTPQIRWFMGTHIYIKFFSVRFAGTSIPCGSKERWRHWPSHWRHVTSEVATAQSLWGEVCHLPRDRNFEFLKLHKSMNQRKYKDDVELWN